MPEAYSTPDASASRISISLGFLREAEDHHQHHPRDDEKHADVEHRGCAERDRLWNPYRREEWFAAKDGRHTAEQRDEQAGAEQRQGSDHQRVPRTPRPEGDRIEC